MFSFMKYSVQTMIGITLAVFTVNQPGSLQAASETLKPGDTFKDCALCPEMVVVPPGSFLMGDTSGGGGAAESTLQQVTIESPFAVGKYEITNIKWQGVERVTPAFSAGDDSPVVGITWGDAQSFLKRLSAKTGHKYRLLSEAEWEYAARGGTISAYPWGNAFDETRANISNHTKPVGQYSANAFGLYDMHGNVSEWVQDCWNGSHANQPPDGSARLTGNCVFRIARGGSLAGAPVQLRSDDRLRVLGEKKYSTVGLRIARTL